RAPPARALETADLEDVRVVCAELDLEWQPHLVFAEVRHANLLKALPLPEQRAAKDVNLPARRDEALAVVQIDVGEIHGEDRRVVRDAGVQQQRPAARDRQLEPRQKAGIRVVEPMTADA